MKHGNNQRFTPHKRRKWTIMLCLACLLTVFLLCTGKITAARNPQGDNLTVLSKTARSAVYNDSIRHSLPISAASSAQGHVTLLSVPDLSFRELSGDSLKQMPALRRLLKKSYLAGVVLRTPGNEGLEDRYLTISAGAPAAADSNMRAWNHTEQVQENGQDLPAAAEYKLYTGRSPGASAVFVPLIEAMQEMNRASSYESEPGLLGQVLEDHHIPVSVYGNSDEGECKQEAGRTNCIGVHLSRYAPLMLMDANGRVAQGDIGSDTVEQDPSYPYGIKTNDALLLKRWSEQQERPGVTLLEYGDLSRLYSQQDRFNQVRFAEMKNKVLTRLDGMIARISQQMVSGDKLWILSPQVNRDAAAEKELLGPFMLYGKGFDSGGLLTSPTTRRDGFITASDIAPTLLSAFGIAAPHAMIGIPVTTVHRTNALMWMQSKLTAMERVYRLRPKVLYPYVGYEVMVLLAALFSVVFRVVWLYPLLTVLLVTLLTAPSLILAEGWFASWPAFDLVSLLILASLAISLGVVGNRRFWLNGHRLISRIGVLSGCTMMLILADGCTGGDAIKHSLLGYDVMYGARYYGIGNEIMGVLVGAAIFSVSVYMERSQRKWKPIWMLLHIGILFYMAAPFLGTNAGGSITATVGFGVLWFVMLRTAKEERALAHTNQTSCNSAGTSAAELRSSSGLTSEVSGFSAARGEASSLLGRFKLAALIGSLPLAALAVLWLLNSALPVSTGRESHIGRALQLLQSGDLNAILAMVLRKLSMNIHLIGVSVWSKVLIASLVVIAAGVLRPWGVFLDWRRRYPYLMNGFTANTIAAFAALAVNDSGIVAAATLIVYVAVPMLILRIYDISVSHSS